MSRKESITRAVIATRWISSTAGSRHRRGGCPANPSFPEKTSPGRGEPLFLVTLEMMKAASDGMLLEGINQIVNHGYPSSPPAAGLPGWTFYASSVINHNNT